MKDVTKRAIQSAYLKLADKKAADKITVKDIALQCGINRNTFYYHYQDIGSLVKDIIKEQTDILISTYPAEDSLRLGVDFAVKEALKNRRTLLHFYGSSNREIVEEYLWQICDRFVDAYVKDHTGEDRSFFIRYQKCFMFGLMIDWLNNGMPESFLEDMHKAFDKLNM